MKRLNCWKKRINKNGNIKDGQKKMYEYLKKVSKIDAKKSRGNN